MVNNGSFGPYPAHYLLKLRREELDCFRDYSERHQISMADLLRAHVRTLVGKRAIERKAKESKGFNKNRGSR